jgi:chromosome segregation ATPase
MKNFQPNLLIILALALCGLCAFQWYEQTVQRNEIVTLNGMVYDRNVAIRDATNSIALLNQQVARMDARLTELKTEGESNATLVVQQKADLAQLRFANAGLTNDVAQYKAGVDALEARLKDAYAGLEKQNEALTNLVAQRDDLVKKLNDEIKDRNDVVSKYNELAQQAEKLQGRGGEKP